MGKNKLTKFAEVAQLPNVIECGAHDFSDNPSAVAMKGNWHTAFFHNDNPIVLELGCGKGEYTVGLAQMFPDKNFIGVDIKGARIWSGAKFAHENGLQNAGFLRTNIEFIDSFFAAGEVSEIWITFPDPQMKKCSKRLTSTHFMRRYQSILKKDGLIHLKTDSNFLFLYTKAMVEENAYAVKCCTDNLYADLQDDPILDIKTYYEQQWLSRGIDIKYISFVLHHKDEFIEPEIDIERDSYRSFGRNARVV